MARRFRKNWGNRLDRNKKFVNRDNVLKDYKANEKIEINVNDKYDSRSDDDFNRNRKANNDEIKKEVMGMMFGNEELTNVYPNTDAIKFIDKDNYNKYLNLKGKFNFLTVLSNQYFWAIYSIVVIVLAILETMRMLSESNIMIVQDLATSISTVIEDNIGYVNPNWGFILIPLIIYTIYKSFNSYSYIKISF
tara:strand:- start:2211 stop:2786 length:576 start_codon:yes stop_codon:yes gene_type:complete